MVISFNCKCGNTNPKDVYQYDGYLGYEALVCRCCGRYSDHNGSYEADNWSGQYTYLQVHPVHAGEDKDE